MDYLGRKGGEGLKFTRAFVIAALSFVLIGCGDTFALVVGGACFIDQLVELRDEKCSLGPTSQRLSELFQKSGSDFWSS